MFRPVSTNTDTPVLQEVSGTDGTRMIQEVFCEARGSYDDARGRQINRNLIDTLAKVLLRSLASRLDRGSGSGSGLSSEGSSDADWRFPPHGLCSD